MPGRRHLPGAHEAIGSGEPTSRHGLLTWWQRRSWRTDLAVLARVRDGLRRLDAEPDGEDHASPQPADTAEPPALEAEARPPARPAPPPVAPSAPEDGADLPPDSAIVAIRDTFRIVLAAGGEPASYFYGRLFASRAAEASPPDETAQLDQADSQDAAAETAQPDGDPPGDGAGSGADGEPAKAEQVPAGVLGGRHHAPPD